VIFIIILSIFFPILFIAVNIPNKKVYRAAHFLPLYASRLVLWFFRIKVNIYNKEIIDVNTQYIFVGNHMSYIDALVSGASNDNYRKYIGKAEILNYPVLGYLLRKLYVPVKREEKTSRKWSMGTMHKYLEDGVSMAIFPEGTCNTTPDLLKTFKDGAFSLSTQLDIPLAVCTIVGAADIMPRRLLSIRPGTIDVYWNTIISPENKEIDELKTLVKNQMLPILKEAYPKGYDYPPVD
ncbi:MAG: lysophospholipid acyltransferase family protein, partial [Chitinophagales bacterium]